MGTKKIIIGMMLLCTTFAHSQQETQIKFQLPKTCSEDKLVKELNEIEDYKFSLGDTYEYHDLYLDTPDRSLYNAGYSLRIRKRIKSDSLHTYVMQLKSEAVSECSERIEVEEKELDFYRLIDSSGQTVFLVDLLDTIFDATGTSTDLTQEFKMLESWLAAKASTSITPFQYLRYHNSGRFSSDKLSSLVVQMVGVSERKRGYVFAHKDNFNGPSALGRSKDDTPVFFQENEDLVWLMETSLDNSIFYSAHSNEQVFLREFEIELKHKNKLLGTQLLSSYQQLVKQQLKGTIIKDSKYRQSLEVMANKNALSKESAF